MSTKQLPTDYQTYIHKSRYARWDDDKGRRETWDETVDRIILYWHTKVDDMDTLSDEDKEEIKRILG